MVSGQEGGVQRAALPAMLGGWCAELGRQVVRVAVLEWRSRTGFLL
jgi:hypothetical protein